MTDALFLKLALKHNEVRISPIELRASQQMALRRLASRAVYKEQQKVMTVPLLRGESPAIMLIGLLQELFDPAD